MRVITLPEYAKMSPFPPSLSSALVVELSEVTIGVWTPQIIKHNTIQHETIYSPLSVSVLLIDALSACHSEDSDDGDVVGGGGVER
jgi:hypothetical protein